MLISAILLHSCDSLSIEKVSSSQKDTKKSQSTTSADTAKKNEKLKEIEDIRVADPVKKEKGGKTTQIAIIDISDLRARRSPNHQFFNFQIIGL